MLQADIFPIDSSYPNSENGQAERARKVFVPTQITDRHGMRPDFAIEEDHQTMTDTVRYLIDLIRQGEPLTLANMTEHKEGSAA